jgi:hypothetical protein
MIATDSVLHPGLQTRRCSDLISVYNDCSAYDELSDNIPPTEKLAMQELDEMLRLRNLGVRGAVGEIKSSQIVSRQPVRCHPPNTPK